MADNVFKEGYPIVMENVSADKSSREEMRNIMIESQS